MKCTASDYRFKCQLFSAGNFSICTPDDLIFWPCYLLMNMFRRWKCLCLTLPWLRSGNRLERVRKSHLTKWSLAADWLIDCSQSPIFPWVRRCRLLSSSGRHLGLLMRAKLGVTPPPLPTGILYSPQFRSHQATKMAAVRTQRSTSTNSRKNRGLWTVSREGE